jgi:hypothetical protein
MQVQLVFLSLPDAEPELAGHWLQDEAAASTEYEPAGHAKHWALPSAALNWPAGHAMQGPPLFPE